jgi:GMP synthase-like glutamine amidotransferase
MIAYALKAEVYKGAKQELGWDTVDITEEGMRDKTFGALAIDNSPQADVFQWHGDTFDLPRNAVRIASSEHCENQAFRYGENVYALQFHIEVKPDMIKDWFEDVKGVDADTIIDQTKRTYPEYRKRAEKFYSSFFV